MAAQGGEPGDAVGPLARKGAQALFPAGSETGRHTHPGEEISFVEAGPFVLEVEGQPAKTLQTGEPFFVPAGVVHNGHPEAGKTAKVVATYVIEKGKPVSTPVAAK